MLGFQERDYVENNKMNTFKVKLTPRAISNMQISQPITKSFSSWYN